MNHGERVRRRRTLWPPRTLLARINIVHAGSAAVIATTAIVALAVFVIRPIEDRSADDEAGLVVLAAQTWVELPPAARPYFEIEMLQAHDLVTTAETRDLPFVAPNTRYHRLLEDKLSARLGTETQLMASDDLLWANVPMGGFSLQVGFSPERRDVRPLYVVLVVVVVAAAIFAVGAAYLVRRVARPLSQAATAVEAFRGTKNFAPLPEEGPAELVTLATSFNAMARDVSALLANRTTLLAGISHDLRTPLTRMRFALELLPDDAPKDVVARLDRNIGAMEELIAGAMRFARGTSEAPRPVDFRAYLEGVLATLDETITLQWHGDAAQADIATGAFERVLANLVHNAQQHGGGASVRADRTAESVTVHVIDEGPGIPPAAREDVFQPFHRLDAARESATGGSGLGLAVARQLCQAHGWEVGIEAAPKGGVDAYVVVPIPGAQASRPHTKLLSPTNQPSPKETP